MSETRYTTCFNSHSSSSQRPLCMFIQQMTQDNNISQPKQPSPSPTSLIVEDEWSIGVCRAKCSLEDSTGGPNPNWEHNKFNSRFQRVHHNVYTITQPKRRNRQQHGHRFMQCTPINCHTLSGILCQGCTIWRAQKNTEFNTANGTTWTRTWWYLWHWLVLLHAT